MEEQLHRIQTWASHGTLRQFRTDIVGRLADQGYEAVIEGNALVCYRIPQKTGFLGIGKRTRKEPVLRIVQVGGETSLAEEPRDETFVALLAKSLEQH